jgi:hypothetical protein
MLLEEDSGVMFAVRILDTGLNFLRALLLVVAFVDVKFVVDVGNDLKRLVAVAFVLYGVDVAGTVDVENVLEDDLNCTLGFLILAYGVPLRLAGRLLVIPVSIPVLALVPALVVRIVVLGLTFDAKVILLKDGVVVDEVVPILYEGVLKAEVILALALILTLALAVLLVALEA